MEEDFRKHKVAPLTREEELELVTKAQAGDKKAAEKLFISYYHFVFKSFLKSRARWKSDREDYIQCAYEGITRALRLYDTSRNVRFMTFAGHHVNAHINRHFSKEISHVKVGTTHGERIVLSNWGGILKKYPKKSNDELATILSGKNKTRKVKPLDVERIRTAFASPDTYLNQKVDNNEDSTTALVDFLKDSKLTADALFEDKEQLELLNTAITICLTPQERYIITKRYCEKPEAHVTIGKRLGISREWVRQKEMQAIKKIRDYMEDHCD